MNRDAVEDELLSPAGLADKLLSLGLLPVEITEEEFYRAEAYGSAYPRLSVHDRIALAIARERKIVLLTGDKALRKAAHTESVEVIGTLGLLDRLRAEALISLPELRECLEALKANNGKAVRLPQNELVKRLEGLS